MGMYRRSITHDPIDVSYISVSNRMQNTDSFTVPSYVPQTTPKSSSNPPQGSSMFAPGVPDIMREFKDDNENIATFVVSVYVLGFAFGPLLAAPLSEIYGRAPVFNIANILFIIATIITALSQNMPMLIIFRFLMGFAGSTPVTNGSGTISDMFPVEERGKAMAVWAMGPLLGPCIGPLMGGYMIEDLGWRWVFWVIAIFVSALIVPESTLD